MQQLAKQIGLPDAINRGCSIFKMHLPYTEAEHVLNITFNVFASGTCLDYLELRRNDDAYLKLLDADRIPDPTTAGDFCRRFSNADLHQSSNRVRMRSGGIQSVRFLWRESENVCFPGVSPL